MLRFLHLPCRHAGRAAAGVPRAGAACCLAHPRWADHPPRSVAPLTDTGTRAGLPLPYRGQAAPVLPSEEEMALLPEGLCRAIAVRNRMTRSVTATQPGAPHAALGLPAYVQFTSPIRRYTDLLAHYQARPSCTWWPAFHADQVLHTSMTWAVAAPGDAALLRQLLLKLAAAPLAKRLGTKRCSSGTPTGV